MSCTRKEFVAQMQSWVGLNEYDGSHKQIVDIYNTIKPLPVGYKLKYSDPWCAGTVSAAAQVCDATDIIPTECSCPRMITKAQKMGIWVEADDYVPTYGDIVLYDWDDSGVGDNKGNSDHVGVVEKRSGNDLTIIEGNYSNAVKRRPLKVNGRYIRGYIVPKFDAEPVVESEPAKDTNVPSNEYTLLQFTKDVQKACGCRKIDGIVGTETMSKTVTVSEHINFTHAVVKPIQKRLYALGYTEVGEIDGVAGKLFKAAVERYQKEVVGLAKPDGEITARNKTWKKLLGMI